MEPKRIIGIVKQKLSRKTYMVELPDGTHIEVHLKLKQIMHYVTLTIGKKIYLELIPPNNEKGTLLTETDFKLNNWPGWSSDYEPNYPS